MVIIALLSIKRSCVREAFSEEGAWPRTAMTCISLVIIFYFIRPLLSAAICHAQLVAATNRVASSLVWWLINAGAGVFKPNLCNWAKWKCTADELKQFGRRELCCGFNTMVPSGHLVLKCRKIIHDGLAIKSRRITGIRPAFTQWGLMPSCLCRKLDRLPCQTCIFIAQLF